MPQSFTRKNKKKVAFMILATFGEEESRVVRGDVASEDVGSSYWGEEGRLWIEEKMTMIAIIS